jgi:hypothetical protein
MSGKSEGWVIYSPESGHFWTGTVFMRGIENAKLFEKERYAKNVAGSLETHSECHRITYTPGVLFGSGVAA